MLAGICRVVFSTVYNRITKNQQRIDQYKSNLGSWETQLNDESRMLINSIKGSVSAEKFINKSGTVNIGGFMNYVKQQYPHFYNSKMFQDYNRRITHLQDKIRSEKGVINKYTRYYNTDLLQHPILTKVWGLEELSYGVWNEGRDVEKVTQEYNNINSVKFDN